VRIGVPRELEPGERRVALVPDAVTRLSGAGFEVVVEPGAGREASFPDAAYGESGRAPPFNAAVRTYQPATGPGDVSAVTPQNIGNPNLKPERGKEIELGFDAGFLDDRLGLEFTYYRKRTTDEILQRDVAPSIGFSGQQYFNAGAVLNQGVELLARARPYASGPVSVDLTFNVATNSNKILSLLPGVTSVSPGTFLQHHVGYPVGSWFARRVVSAELDAMGNPINVLCDDGNGGTTACGSAPNVSAWLRSWSATTLATRSSLDSKWA